MKQAANHLISRRIVDQHPHSILGLEDLTHIRERTRRRHGKQATQKLRRANRHAAKWAFAELHGYIAYKALLAVKRAPDAAIPVRAIAETRACSSSVSGAIIACMPI